MFHRGSRFIRSINTRYICGRIPLLHTIILSVYLFTMARLMSRFDYYYETKPLLTMMVTNSILNGIADTAAQAITSIRERAVRQPGGVTEKDSLAIQIHEFDKRNPLPRHRAELIPPSHNLPPPFDFERLVLLTRFMAWGFIMAPLQFKWLSYLGTAPALKRVALDQLGFAPFGLGLFLSYLTVTEGGGTKAIKKRMEQLYFPTLKASYMIWPLVQILNFRVVPLQFQLPFASTVGIFWTCFISLTTSSTRA
ncbi:hypothetical protein BDZ91DRAFT_711551 [Kalaharituber pfeilii]|nr:hypothetical protein BDZ91DRAFT_711551 [Kalaharituber pfeilii]